MLRLQGEYLSFPQYSSTGHMIFGRGGKNQRHLGRAVRSRRVSKQTGEPFLMAGGAFSPSLSREGTLTFIGGSGVSRVSS